MKLFEKSKYFCIFHELPRYTLGLGYRSPFIKSFQAYSPLPLGTLKVPPFAVASAQSPDRHHPAPAASPEIGWGLRPLPYSQVRFIAQSTTAQRTKVLATLLSEQGKTGFRQTHPFKSNIASVTMRRERGRKSRAGPAGAQLEEQPAALRRNRRKADALGNQDAKRKPSS